jgi:hypothetical protein
MIPRPAIVEWGRRVSWPSFDQIEQDLLLSTAKILITFAVAVAELLR